MPHAVVYCPPCAAAEFGYRSDVAENYVCAWDPLPAHDDLEAGSSLEVAPGRPTGRSKIPRLVCRAGVRDLFRHTIFGIGGRGGVGRLHRACGGPIRRRPPSQLGVRDLHPAVRSRGPQDVEDRVIGCSSGFRQPAKIPARYRRVRVVLAKRPVQRGILQALQHLASPIQRGDVSCIQQLQSLSSVRAFPAVSAGASPTCLTWLSVRLARRRRAACTSRRDNWRNVEESPTCVEYGAPSTSRHMSEKPRARQHVAPYGRRGGVFPPDTAAPPADRSFSPGCPLAVRRKLNDRSGTNQPSGQESSSLGRLAGESDGQGS